jgi:conjugal transfer pilus assembly protein TraB
MASTKSIIPNLKNTTWKKWAMLISIAVGVYLVLWFMLSSDTSKAPPVAVDNAKSATTNVMAAGSQIDARERWIGTAGAQLANQEKQLGDLSSGQTRIDDRLAKLETMAGKPNLGAMTTNAAPSMSTPVFPPGSPAATPTGIASPSLGLPIPPPPQGASSGAMPAGTPPPPNSYVAKVAEPTIGHMSLRSSGNAAGNAVPVAGLTTASGSTPAIVSATGSGDKKTSTKQASVSYLPVGFVRARLLGGMDAPTNGQAQNEPLPVILELLDEATLPNGFRANVKKCMVIGAAWGDLSSERAYIRAESLNCIRHDGSTLEVRAKGSVYGEDGKLGVRGRLVSKQGQILANALLAGAIGGIGQGIQYRATTTSVSPLAGAVTTTNPNQGFEAGFGNGVGRALDRLANYYITLAEKTFPVIEVDSERVVDVAFTKGMELDIPLPDDNIVLASRRAPARQENIYD